MDQVLGYTLAQLRGFLLAAARQEAQRDARLLALIATATRGESHQIERSIDALLRESQRTR